MIPDRPVPSVDVVARLRAAGCVFAEEEAALLFGAASGADHLEALLARRVAGEPVEHVVGWAAFRGLRVAVDPGVFVPRVRSEHLAGVAVSAARDAAAASRGAPAVVVDLCCGSGALALAVGTEVPGLEVHAADVDPAAVACTVRNLARLGPPAPRVHAGDLDAALPADLAGRVDVLVANVPYVPTSALATLPAEARLHERRVALDGGADGLDLVRRLAVAASRLLAADGVVLVETSDRQAPGAVSAFTAAGLEPSVVGDDEIVVVRGRRPSPAGPLTCAPGPSGDRTPRG